MRNRWGERREEDRWDHDRKTQRRKHEGNNVNRQGDRQDSQKGQWNQNIRQETQRHTIHEAWQFSVIIITISVAVWCFCSLSGIFLFSYFLFYFVNYIFHYIITLCYVLLCCLLLFSRPFSCSPVFLRLSIFPPQLSHISFVSPPPFPMYFPGPQFLPCSLVSCSLPSPMFLRFSPPAPHPLVYLGCIQVNS